MTRLRPETYRGTLTPAESEDVVQYRSFRNTDPPQLTEVWNETFTGRGAIPLPSPTPLERFVLAKPYFDPNGLILAEDEGRVIGFGHAGLSIGQPQQGVVSLVGVRPAFQRRGIGTELLRRCEAYLGERGATTILAGAKGSQNPFYLGLYGGCDSPGILDSDVAGRSFVTKLGYQDKERVLVFHRDLAKPVKVVDTRFAKVRQRYELHARSPRRLKSYAQEGTIGAVEPLEFYLQDRQTTATPARTLVWEMEGFGWRWGRPSVGLVCFEVEPQLRRQGLGKFLLTMLLKQLQEQYFEIAELQLDEKNQESVHFVHDVNFEQVDVGRVYIRRPV